MTTSKLPSIADDIRQPSGKIKLSLTPKNDIPDDEVSARSRELGERWGASTQIAPAKSPPEPQRLTAPLTSVRFDAPDYLDRELSVRAAEQGVTKTYLILRALGDAGLRLDEVDLVKDRRRWKR